MRLVGLARWRALDLAGLVERRPSPSDRRVQYAAITKAGEAMLREALATLPSWLSAGVVSAARAAGPASATNMASRAPTQCAVGRRIVRGVIDVMRGILETCA